VEHPSGLRLAEGCWTWLGPIDEVRQQCPAPTKASLHSKVSRLEGRTKMAIHSEVVLLSSSKVADWVVCSPCDSVDAWYEGRPSARIASGAKGQLRP
jgi:hypothetical protein